LNLGRLASGPIILSGDLYHLKESREREIVPSLNSNRADTLASMNRIEATAKNIYARVTVQHDPADFKSLPKPPAFLK
jgi:N-acyl homoserine lactone hydrolase